MENKEIKNDNVCIEIEEWVNCDDYGKARTRLLIRANDVGEALFNRMLLAEKYVLPALKETVYVKTPSPALITPIKAQEPLKTVETTEKANTATKKTYSNKYKSGYNGKRGKSLNEQFGLQEPDNCPDCHCKLIPKLYTNREGLPARRKSCEKCGNVWWDNNYNPSADTK